MDDLIIELSDSRYQRHGFDRSSGSETVSHEPPLPQQTRSREIAGRLQGLATEHAANVDRREVRHQDSRKHYDGGMGNHVYETLAIAFSASGGAIAFLKFARELLIEWMKASAGKSIRIKFKDTEVQARTLAELEAALALIDKHTETQAPAEPRDPTG
ncbi:hypothetical protein ASE35_06030 [Lysobacter sp. Root916]|uniref:hypothetical protein n=1 Tax=Lysobacter sp. Root916 TaxID=1736606 RepID=UPI00071052EE|nr:hypothetical protein [Lysobacter sp. Root916]KRD39875.1 hypothetical protein ASE35_06030 [Lysobacter sp. Root916]